MTNETRIFNVLLLPGGGRELSLKRLHAAQRNTIIYDVDAVIFTGGGIVPASCPDPSQTIKEADLMRSHYQSPHHKAQLILVENESLDTYQNIESSLKLLANTLGESASGQYDEIHLIIATDADHLQRFKLSFVAVALESWSLDMTLRATYFPLFGMRSLKDRLIEYCVFIPIHWFSPTGMRWPINWLMQWQRRKRTAQQLQD